MKLKHFKSLNGGRYHYYGESVGVYYDIDIDTQPPCVEMSVADVFSYEVPKSVLFEAVAIIDALQNGEEIK